MAWETRGGTKRYYTRSRRVKGRVVREYLGRGERAEQAAREDRQARLDRQARKQQQALEVARFGAIIRMGEEYHDAVEIVSRAMMICAGYHYHRGEWRKRRVPKDRRQAVENGQPIVADPAPNISSQAAEEVRPVQQSDQPSRPAVETGDRPARRRPVPQPRAFVYHGGFLRGRLDTRGQMRVPCHERDSSVGMPPWSFGMLALLPDASMAPDASVSTGVPFLVCGRGPRPPPGAMP
jgi:hypothetical protein